MRIAVAASIALSDRHFPSPPSLASQRTPARSAHTLSQPSLRDASWPANKLGPKTGRVTHKKTFDKETGEMVMEELPKLDWDAVGDDFLVRQQAVLDKAKARQAAALKSKAEPIVFVKEKGPKSKWKPSKVRRVRACVPRLRLRLRPRPRRGGP